LALVEKKCAKCLGEGTYFGNVVDSPEPCPDCEGKGYLMVEPGREDCDECNMTVFEPNIPPLECKWEHCPVYTYRGCRIHQECPCCGLTPEQYEEQTEDIVREIKMEEPESDRNREER
jgi:hypothetical protein